MNHGNKLRRVGSLWKPKPGAKSLGSGTMTIKGWRQRFVILRNDRKTEGSKDPDYVLLSSDEPVEDSYTSSRAPKAEPHEQEADDDIPF